jgi:hypothetical protein
LTWKPLYLVYVHNANTSRYAPRGLPVWSFQRSLRSFRVNNSLLPNLGDQLGLCRRNLGGLFDVALPGLSKTLARRRRTRVRSL